MMDEQELDELLDPLKNEPIGRLRQLITRLQAIDVEISRARGLDLVREPVIQKLARDYLLALRADNYTFAQIAELYNVTPERIREMYKRLTGETEDLRRKGARASRG